MDINAYIDEIKLKLTGDLINIELDDTTLMRIVNSSLREIQRYINTVKLITIPFSPCIDLSEYKVSAVTKVYRSKGYYNSVGNAEISNVPADPMYMSQWQILSGNGLGYNSSNWVYNYLAWNTASQLRNTLSTDLYFRFDKDSNKLYVNVSFDRPKDITVEYIPRYDDVSEITSDFWIDIIIKLAVALTKVTLGRIRTRYTQDNALWKQDGEQLLTEGNAELDQIREQLRLNAQLCYPID